MKVVIALGIGAWVVITLLVCFCILGFVQVLTMDEQKPGAWAIAIVIDLGIMALSGYGLYELLQ
jgi:hypothetical protein